MFSMPRSMNDRTSSIRMSPSSLRLARPMRSRSTATMWRPLDQTGGGRLCDRRRGSQHFVLRPVGMGAPVPASAEDSHSLWIALELGLRGVERGEVRVFRLENDVVEVARNR